MDGCPGSQAHRDLKRLNHQSQARVAAALVRYAETGLGDVVRLQGVDPHEWRLRVGDWRVRFTCRYEDRVVEVLRVVPRGKAYRR